MVDSFPVIHELVREWRFPHFFEAGNQPSFPVIQFAWFLASKKGKNRRSQTKIRVTRG